MAVLEDSCSGFFFFLSTKYIFTQVDKYPYERDKCQQIILIINLILTIFLLICSLWSTLIVATRRFTIFGDCEKKATFPKKKILYVPLIIEHQILLFTRTKIQKKSGSQYKVHPTN